MDGINRLRYIDITFNLPNMRKEYNYSKKIDKMQYAIGPGQLTFED